MASEPKNPAFMDTKGWVLHLLGRDSEALPLLRAAVAAAPLDSPSLAEGRGHLAMVEKASKKAPDGR